MEHTHEGEPIEPTMLLRWIKTHGGSTLQQGWRRVTGEGEILWKNIPVERIDGGPFADEYLLQPPAPGVR